MKVYLAIFCLIYLYGCQSQTLNEIKLPMILSLEGKDFISVEAMEEYQLKIERPEDDVYSVITPENGSS